MLYNTITDDMIDEMGDLEFEDNAAVCVVLASDGYPLAYEKGFPIEGLDTPIGPTSSITGITIAQALVCQVVDNLVKAGIKPPVFKSSNVDGGDEHNNRMFDTYYGYWK